MRRHMCLTSAILPNVPSKASAGRTLIVSMREVEAAFLIQMNSELNTIVSAACHLSVELKLQMEM